MSDDLYKPATDETEEEDNDYEELWTDIVFRLSFIKSLISKYNLNTST